MVAAILGSTGILNHSGIIIPYLNVNHFKIYLYSTFFLGFLDQ